MPKVVLWDADGVTIERSEYFSQRFAREHGAPEAVVVVFFKGPYRLCQTGKADLKDELAKVLPSWGWQGSVDEFLAYWFAGDKVSEPVVAQVRELQAQGVVCCLATDQEQYRAKYVREQLFKDAFDQYFFSYQLGYSKEEPAFFEAVVRQLGVSPSEVVYWDDDQKNVDAAKLAGIDARLYTKIEDLV